MNKIILLLVIAILLVSCMPGNAVVDEIEGSNIGLFFLEDKEHGVICYAINSKNGIDCIWYANPCNQ